MDYIVAVQAPAYPVTATTFATESAFAHHLKELRRSLDPRFDRLVLVAPRLTREEYEAKRDHLGFVDADRDEVVLVPAHERNTSAKQFWWKEAGPLWRRLRQAIQGAGIVHSGMSDDLWRPLMAMTNAAAWLARRPVIFVVDIDFRHHSWRYYRTHLWRLRSYLVNRFAYDPLRWLQVWLAVRAFDLVLLKSGSMVQDFGRGRPHVKNFYDTAHSIGDVLRGDALQRRVAWMSGSAGALRLAYFGRFVPYKGLDRAIEAVRLARARGADIRLKLIGEGECQDALKRQVEASGLQGAVDFHPPVPYGPDLFEQLNDVHLAIATPLVEDTPRAAFDAMARGLPIVAFDISYFRDLANDSDAVILARWNDAQSLADQLVACQRDMARLEAMAQRGVRFAAENTQEIWLERRAAWVRELTVLPAITA